MSAATQANLFRPFFTTNPRPESAGLGLVSVLRMVRRAGGTIQVESAPGHGTEVAILFPPADARNGKKPQPSQCIANAGTFTAKSGPNALQSKNQT
jgi:nitrogen-specific signal transduction histidine kinase